MGDITIYDLPKDTQTDIAFQIIPLDEKTKYDDSLPHRHKYYEIFLFEKGNGTHMIDFTSYKINSHSIHFVSPGQIHLLKKPEGSKANVILFTKDFYYLNKIINHIISEIPFLNYNLPYPVINLDKNSFNNFYILLENIKKEYHNTDNNLRETIIISYLNILIINSLRLFKLNPDNNYLAPTNYCPDLFMDFRKLLEKNFAKWHMVADYAKALNTTEKALAEHIKKATGLTVIETIHNRILLEAKRLLMHTEMSSKEIAHLLSFDDPSYFGKFFKSKAGESPNSFRKSSRKNYQL